MIYTARQQNDNKKKTGNAWEEYYFSVFGGTRNSDWFDRTGDGVTEDKAIVEVKGQVPYYLNAYLRKLCKDIPEAVEFVFSVPIMSAKGHVFENQLPKCLKADELIWGHTPDHGNNRIRMYRATTRNHFQYDTNDGRLMAAFYDYELIYDKEDKDFSDYLRKHSNSARIAGNKSPYYRGYK